MTPKIITELAARPWQTSGEVAKAIGYTNERACSARMGQMKQLQRRKMFEHKYRPWCWVYAVKE